MKREDAEWVRWAIALFLTTIVTILLYSVSTVWDRMDRLEDKLERIYLYLLRSEPH